MRFSLAFIVIFLPLTIGKLEESEEDLNPYEVLKIAKVLSNKFFVHAKNLGINL
jgi:hypothetical protein